jgi:large subunit ribosomal protein L15
VIDHDALKAAGLAWGGKDGVRLLGKGELTAKVSFKVAGASKGAVPAVEKAGGKVEVIAPKPEAAESASKEAKAPKAKKAEEAAAPAAEASAPEAPEAE